MFLIVTKNGEISIKDQEHMKFSFNLNKRVVKVKQIQFGTTNLLGILLFDGTVQIFQISNKGLKKFTEIDFHKKTV